MDFFTYYESPLGPLLLTSDGCALTGLWMQTQLHPAPAGEESGCLPVFAAARAWLDAYFRGENPDVAGLALAPAGTPFQQLVWTLLLEIPWGGIRSYGELALEAARRLGKPRMSAQAVGQAVGRNPISILIPCHRVVGARGQLTGYAGGLDKKIWLLRHEGHDDLEENK